MQELKDWARTIIGAVGTIAGLVLLMVVVAHIGRVDLMREVQAEMPSERIPYAGESIKQYLPVEAAARDLKIGYVDTVHAVQKHEEEIAKISQSLKNVEMRLLTITQLMQRQLELQGQAKKVPRD